MVIVLGIAILAGYVLGGRLRNLAGLRPIGVPVLLLAAYAQIVLRLTRPAHGPHGSGATSGVITVLTFVALVAVTAWNAVRCPPRVRPGYLFLAAGCLINGVAVVANGGMPTPPEVLSGPPLWVNDWLLPHAVPHVALDGAARVPWLADALSLRVPDLFVMPFSVGDALIAIGAVTLVALGMTTRPAPAAPATATRWRLPASSRETRPR